MAQSVEQLTLNQWVGGSSPPGCTSNITRSSVRSCGFSAFRIALRITGKSGFCQACRMSTREITFQQGELWVTPGRPVAAWRIHGRLVSHQGTAEWVYAATTECSATGSSNKANRACIDGAGGCRTRCQEYRRSLRSVPCAAGGWCIVRKKKGNMPYVTSGDVPPIATVAVRSRISVEATERRGLLRHARG